MSARRSLTLALAVIAVIGAAAREVCAERLPVRKYTTADGLAGDYIVSIGRDSRGFLWFSSREGLARFDGLRFTTYGLADGLPTAVINRMIETRSGIYWIGTNGGGVCRFNPRGRRPTAGELTNDRQTHSVATADLLFTRYHVADEAGTNRINVLFEDHAGSVWVGTDLGLFRMHTDGGRVDFRRVPLAPLPSDPTRQGVHAIVEDGEGSLWIGGGWGLTRRLADGRAVAYHMQPKGARDRVQALLLDREKRLWVASGSGLTVMNTDSAAAFTGTHGALERTVARALTNDTRGTTGALSAAGEMARWYTAGNGLPHDSVGALYQSADGHVWIGTVGGLCEFDGGRFRIYQTVNGLVDNNVTAIADDSAGNLWIGTVTGVTRILSHAWSPMTKPMAFGAPECMRWERTPPVISSC